LIIVVVVVVVNYIKGHYRNILIFCGEQKGNIHILLSRKICKGRDLNIWFSSTIMKSDGIHVGTI